MIDEKPNPKRTESEIPSSQPHFEFVDRQGIAKKETEATPYPVETETIMEDQTADTHRHGNSGRHIFDGLMIYRGEHYC